MTTPKIITLTDLDFEPYIPSPQDEAQVRAKIEESKKRYPALYDESLPDPMDEPDADDDDDEEDDVDHNDEEKDPSP